LDKCSSDPCEDIHQDFHLLLNEVNKTDPGIILKTENRLFVEKTFHIKKVSVM
jgi:hypothetical protein